MANWWAELAEVFAQMLARRWRAEQDANGSVRPGGPLPNQEEEFPDLAEGEPDRES